MNRVVPGVLALMLAAAAGAEFRRFDPIATPEAVPPGMTPVSLLRPLERELVEEVIRRFFASWNTAQLGDHIDADFFDRERLLDAMDARVPRDASLRILAIQGVQTLEQFVPADSQEERLVVSVVSATVRSQVEFEDPVLGPQRLEGVNELILEVTVRIGGRSGR